MRKRETHGKQPPSFHGQNGHAEENDYEKCGSNINGKDRLGRTKPGRLSKHGQVADFKKTLLMRGCPKSCHPLDLLQEGLLGPCFHAWNRLRQGSIGALDIVL